MEEEIRTVYFYANELQNISKFLLIISIDKPERKTLVHYSRYMYGSPLTLYSIGTHFDTSTTDSF